MSDLQQPIPMVLHCPACRFQHVDAADEHRLTCSYNLGASCDCGLYWTNPPHRTHLCKACGHLWKPANVATTGVQELPQ